VNTVEVRHVVKSYADKVAVNDLSFTVGAGEVFGLIGPNGAGKTTTIRMMMDIIKPDSGEVTILGEKLGEAAKNRLGYLPEERGLYRKMRVIDSIMYLASLKGVPPQVALARARELLERTGMLPNQNKKIEELSRGMGQIIQFIVTIIHDPELIVLDEAFSGLDPVNTELLKGFVTDLRSQGKAIIMSTHQMNQVEELCDRILMVDHGRAVLYGDLREIKSKYSSNSVRVAFEGDAGELPGVVDRNEQRDYTELTLDSSTTPQKLLALLISRGVKLSRFEIAIPPLNEIFLRVAGRGSEGEGLKGRGLE
jgi:ABC-2 type transport system ATP-binding protein